MGWSCVILCHKMGGSAFCQVYHCKSLGWLCIFSGAPYLLSEIAMCHLMCFTATNRVWFLSSLVSFCWSLMWFLVIPVVPPPLTAVAPHCLRCFTSTHVVTLHLPRCNNATHKDFFFFWHHTKWNTATHCGDLVPFQVFEGQTQELLSIVLSVSLPVTRVFLHCFRYLTASHGSVSESFQFSHCPLLKFLFVISCLSLLLTRMAVC